MKEYVCSICNQPFKRYESQVLNSNPTCSKVCLAKKLQNSLKGKLNPNYKNGRWCKESYCSCGKKKDSRAGACACCAKRGFPLDKSSLISDEKIKETIQTSKTISETAKSIHVSRTRVSKLIGKEQIATPHFTPCTSRPYQAEEILINGHEKRNGTVKKLLIKNCLLPYTCEKCGISNSWNGETLRLELDHINGNPTDNRIKNLRFLCPNCHSQTETYTGKNKK